MHSNFYQGHLALDSFGATAQNKFAKAKVLSVGAGGLAASALLALTTSGIGKIGILDKDKVSLSNLQRQTLFTNQDLNQPKALVAANRLKQHNSQVVFESYIDFLTADNAKDYIKNYDIILDCADNADTSLIINQACQQRKLPWVHAGIKKTAGQLALFTPKTACYACVFSAQTAPKTDCSKIGVFMPTVGVFGFLQASETLKYLNNQKAEAELITLDMLTLAVNRYKTTKQKTCSICAI